MELDVGTPITTTPTAPPPPLNGDVWTLVLKRVKSRSKSVDVTAALAGDDRRLEASGRTLFDESEASEYDEGENSVLGGADSTGDENDASLTHAPDAASAREAAALERMQSWRSAVKERVQLRRYYQDVKKQYEAAVHGADVVLHAKDLKKLHEVPLEHQGCEEFYTEENIQKRFKLRNDERLAKAVADVWKLLPKTKQSAAPSKDGSTVATQDSVNFNVFRAFSAYVFHRLVPAGTAAEFESLIAQDFADACQKSTSATVAPASAVTFSGVDQPTETATGAAGGAAQASPQSQQGLSEPQFSEAMLDVIDVWTDSIDIEKYLHFTRAVLQRQAKKCVRIDPTAPFDLRNVFVKGFSKRRGSMSVRGGASSFTAARSPKQSPLEVSLTGVGASGQRQSPLESSLTPRGGGGGGPASGPSSRRSSLSPRDGSDLASGAELTSPNGGALRAVSPRILELAQPKRDWHDTSRESQVPLDAHGNPLRRSPRGSMVGGAAPPRPSQVTQAAPTKEPTSQIPQICVVMSDVAAMAAAATTSSDRSAERGPDADAPDALMGELAGVFELSGIMASLQSSFDAPFDVTVVDGGSGAVTDRQKGDIERPFTTSASEETGRVQVLIVKGLETAGNDTIASHLRSGLDAIKTGEDRPAEIHGCVVGAAAEATLRGSNEAVAAAVGNSDFGIFTPRRAREAFEGASARARSLFLAANPSARSNGKPQEERKPSFVDVPGVVLQEPTVVHFDSDSRRQSEVEPAPRNATREIAPKSITVLGLETDDSVKPQQNDASSASKGPTGLPPRPPNSSGAPPAAVAAPDPDVEASSTRRQSTAENGSAQLPPRSVLLRDARSAFLSARERRVLSEADASPLAVDLGAVCDALGAIRTPGSASTSRYPTRAVQEAAIAAASNGPDSLLILVKQGTEPAHSPRLLLRDEVTSAASAGPINDAGASGRRKSAHFANDVLDKTAGSDGAHNGDSKRHHAEGQPMALVLPSPSVMVAHKAAIGRKLTRAHPLPKPPRGNPDARPPVPVVRFPYVQKESPLVAVAKSQSRTNAELVAFNGVKPAALGPSGLDYQSTHFIDQTTPRVMGKGKRGKIVCVDDAKRCEVVQQQSDNPFHSTEKLHSSEVASTILTVYEQYDRPILEHRMRNKANSSVKRYVEEARKVDDRTSYGFLESLICSNPENVRALESVAAASADGLIDPRFEPVTVTGGSSKPNSDGKAAAPSAKDILDEAIAQRRRADELKRLAHPPAQQAQRGAVVTRRQIDEPPAPVPAVILALDFIPPPSNGTAAIVPCPPIGPHRVKCGSNPLRERQLLVVRHQRHGLSQAATLPPLGSQTARPSAAPLVGTASGGDPSSVRAVTPPPALQIPSSGGDAVHASFYRGEPKLGGLLRGGTRDISAIDRALKDPSARHTDTLDARRRYAEADLELERKAELIAASQRRAGEVTGLDLKVSRRPKAVV